MATPSAPLNRQSCAWCGERDRWPDRCCEDGDPVCAEIIPMSCEWGDHRRCVPETCDLSAEVHPQIIAAGVAAAVAAAEAFAVVSVMESDTPTVIGCGSHLGRVKSLVRSRHIKRCGAEIGPASKGLVYVVSVSGWLY